MTSADVLARYEAVRQHSTALAAPLSAEDAQIQSMPDASPAKWHLAHVTWFFETFILERFESGFEAFDPAFRVLFNSYYKGVGAQHPRAQRGLVSRPSLDAVMAYRANVDARMKRLLTASHAEAQAGVLRDLVILGLHHEQQHQELLLTDIQHALWHSPVETAYVRQPSREAVAIEPLRWVQHPGGLVEIGHDPHLDGPFCFDNETPRHRQWLDPYELASRPVTCGEFLAFMDDGGYDRPELWLSMGWDWVQAGGRCAPLYWDDGETGHRWTQHTLYGKVPVDPNAIAFHLSYFEADAYARWAEARLPTEGEWENAARRGLELSGHAWEWTSSSYAPYPGYRPLPGAVGEYNGKFMCNQYVLRGGSVATPKGHARASYRNFFPPDAQWQFTGLRLARDLSR